MKIQFVVSDLTYPPVEGLHEQIQMLMSALVVRGHDVRVSGFARHVDLLDTNALHADLGVAFEPIFYTGSSLAAALMRRPKPIDTGADVLHLEGPLAILRGRTLPRPSVASWVDPGSLRYKRLAVEQLGLRRLKLLIASKIYGQLEKGVPSTTPVHVVSNSDANYLRSRHGNDAHGIPVIARAHNNSERWSRQASSRPPIITIYGDLRLPHIRQGFERFIKAISGTDRTWRVRVMGRVSSSEVARMTNGFDCEVIQWAKDVDAVLLDSDCVVLPDISGTGLKNRAIQCLAIGVPVVGTTSAFESIIEAPSTAIAIEPEGLVDLIDSEIERHRHGAAGPISIERYEAGNVAQQWESLYQRAIGQYIETPAELRK